MASYLESLARDLLPDAETREFTRHNRKIWGEQVRKPGGPEILVELYPVAQTVISFAYFANILAKRNGARILSFSSSGRHALVNQVRHWKLHSVYRSFNTVGHLNSGDIGPQAAGRAEAEFHRIRSVLKSKWDIFSIVVEGCPIGCDIYESFLMEYRKPTVDPDSEDFEAHLKSCLRFFYFWQDYLESHTVKGLILSHGLYKYGLLKRLCIREGIPVYLPTVRSMLYLSAMEELGNPKFEAYREHFRNLPPEMREQGLAWAKAQLDRRMAGEVGVDMHYSTKSAYGEKRRERLLKDGPQLKVLIATHCFFDNPHAYGVNLFPDFLEWLEYLGRMSDETDYDWYLKTHPDVLPGNAEIIAQILEKYPKIKKLPETASHHQLCEEGMAVVLTTYGSIGHEYPMLGKNVINAGMNPHIAYDFNYHARSLEEYERLLRNLGALDKRADLQELYEFYFIHYKCNSVESLFFVSHSDFTAKLSIQEQNSSASYRYFIGESTDARHRSLVATIEAFLDSRDYKYFPAEYPFPKRRAV